jgi:hypothetical protein
MSDFQFFFLAVICAVICTWCVLASAGPGDE